MDKYRLAPFVGTLQAANQLGIQTTFDDPQLAIHVPSQVQGIQTISEATRVATQVAQTEGLQVVRFIPQKENWLKAVTDVIGAGISLFASGGASAPGVAAKFATTDYGAPPAIVQSLGVLGPTTYPTSGGHMGFFEDFNIGSIGSVFGGQDSQFNWGNALNLGVGLATNAFAPNRGVPGVQPAMASVPAVVRGAGAVATVGRSLFNRFPNLATGIQRLRNAGQRVNRAKLYSVMKRFGPEFLVSGGLLTAAAVNELAVAGPGRRRMNPANAKALRRSVRRIESFHRLCKSTDIIKGRRKRC